MDPTELLKYYKSKKGVKGFPGAKETFDDG
jgi:hypothetical protein